MKETRTGNPGPDGSVSTHLNKSKVYFQYYWPSKVLLWKYSNVVYLHFGRFLSAISYSRSWIAYAPKINLQAY